MPSKPDLFKGDILCPNCRKSRTFYIQDGLTYCKKCSFQQDIATQTEIPGDGIPQIRQTTRKRKDSTERVSKIYRGASAKELFLQAFQLILWKQCNALMHEIGLPDELELVVKNLWALRLQLLVDTVDAVSDDDRLFSSQPQPGVGESGASRRPLKKRMYKAMPSLIDSLGICYLGMMLLRLPVGVGELHRWATQEDILFIRAIRYVPAIIKEKLPAEYLMVLDSTSAPEIDQVRETIDNLGRFYSHHFAIVLPPLNAPLLLFKLIRSLALPISVFSLVRKLANLLSIDFSFPRPGQRHLASLSPEASLISLLVVAVKLYHPFDDLPRFVTAYNDPAVIKVDWTKWVEAEENHDSRIQSGSCLAQGSEMHILEEDVMRMSGEQMDAYLDWYERTWIDEDRAQNKKRPLNEDFRKWFPIASREAASPTTLDHVEQMRQESESGEKFSMDVIRAMQMREVTSESQEALGDTVMTVGSCYRRYRTRQDLPPQALIFHKRAASAAGMSLESLQRAVMQIEGRLMKWRAQRFKGKGKEKGGGPDAAVPDSDSGRTDEREQ